MCVSVCEEISCFLTYRFLEVDAAERQHACEDSQEDKVLVRHELSARECRHRLEQERACRLEITD